MILECCVHGLGLDDDMCTRVDDAIVLRVYSAKCGEEVRRKERANGKRSETIAKKLRFFL